MMCMWLKTFFWLMVGAITKKSMLVLSNKPCGWLVSFFLCSFSRQRAIAVKIKPPWSVIYHALRTRLISTISMIVGLLIIPVFGVLLLMGETNGVKSSNFLKKPWCVNWKKCNKPCKIFKITLFKLLIILFILFSFYYIFTFLQETIVVFNVYSFDFCLIAMHAQCLRGIFFSSKYSRCNLEKKFSCN